MTTTDFVTAWSVVDSDTVVGPIESSFMDAVSTESSVEITRLVSPRYGELEHILISAPSKIRILQSTTEYTQKMRQFQR